MPSIFHKSASVVMSLLSPFLGLIFFTSISSLPSICNAGTYLDSAHGQLVNRTVMETAGYAIGNCAHCHEQHASLAGIEPDPNPTGLPSSYALFSDSFSGQTSSPYAQTDLFCFFCHTSTAATSYQVGGISGLNLDYSATFGGYTTDSPAGIMEAFNQYSYHNLNDIKTFITDPAQSSWGFTTASNPCTACHNPHLAKHNKANVTDPSYTAISRPSDHGNLWGDDDNATPEERMDEITNNDYQAPLAWGGSSYEPNGTITGDGSNMPAYNTFCLDCHTSEITSTVLTPELGRDLYALDWSSTGGDISTAGDKHGANNATGLRSILTPYGSIATKANYTLACVDCHDPHGTPNAFLIRREVNNAVTTAAGAVWSKQTSTDDTSTIGNLCASCHIFGSANMKVLHHDDAEAPYIKQSTGGNCVCHPGTSGSPPIPCENCHFHGAWVGPGSPFPDTVTPDKTAPTTRVTF